MKEVTIYRVVRKETLTLTTTGHTVATYSESLVAAEVADALNEGREYEFFSPLATVRYEVEKGVDYQ